MGQEEASGDGDRRSRAPVTGEKQERAVHLCSLSLGPCSRRLSEEKRPSPLRILLTRISTVVNQGPHQVTLGTRFRGQPGCTAQLPMGLGV